MSEDALANALISKLQPVFYIIGLIVVLGITSFGGTLITLWMKSRDKKENQVTQALSDNTVAIARLESKLDLIHFSPRQRCKCIG